MVDIGAGTTDVAIFTDGAIRHTAVIPIAGDLITSDIAMALRTPTKDAEEIKVEFGVPAAAGRPGEQVEVPGLGDRGPRMLSRQALAGVIEPRRGDLLAGAPGDPRVGYEELLSSGIVLTGGSAVMPAWSSWARTSSSSRCAARRLPTYRPAVDMVASPRSATVMGLLEEARLARRAVARWRRRGRCKTLSAAPRDGSSGISDERNATTRLPAPPSDPGEEPMPKRLRPDIFAKSGPHLARQLQTENGGAMTIEMIEEFDQGTRSRSSASAAAAATPSST